MVLHREQPEYQPGSSLTMAAWQALQCKHGKGVNSSVLRRAGHTAIYTQLGSESTAGRILVLCGRRGSAFTQDLLSLSLTDCTWTVISAQLPFPPRANHATIVVGNTQLWLFGGADTRVVFDDVWCLDLPSGRWHQPALWGECKAYARCAAAVELHPTLPHVILVMGGYGSPEDGTNTFEYFNNMIAIDTRTCEVKILAVGGCPPVPRCFHTMTALQGRLVVVGGRTVNGAHIMGPDMLACFCPATNTWLDVDVMPCPATGITLLPSPRSSHKAVAWGERLLVTGGNIGSTHPSDPADGLALWLSLECRTAPTQPHPQPVTMAWSVEGLGPAPGRALPQARSGHACCLVGSQAVVTLGYTGSKNKAYLPDVLYMDLARLPPPPQTPLSVTGPSAWHPSPRGHGAAPALAAGRGGGQRSPPASPRSVGTYIGVQQAGVVLTGEDGGWRPTKRTHRDQEAPQSQEGREGLQQTGRHAPGPSPTPSPGRLPTGAHPQAQQQQQPQPVVLYPVAAPQWTPRVPSSPSSPGQSSPTYAVLIDSAAAEAHTQLSILQLELRDVHNHLGIARQKADTAEWAADELRRQLTARTAELEHLHREALHNRSAYNNSLAQVQQVQAQVAQLIDDKQVMTVERGELLSEGTEAVERCKQADTRAAQTEEHLQLARQEINKLAQGLSQRESELAAARLLHEQLQQELINSRLESTRHQGETEAARQQTLAATGEGTALRQALAAAEGRAEATARDHAAAVRELESGKTSLNQQLELVKAQLDTSRAQTAHVTEEAGAAQAQCARLQASVEELRTAGRLLLQGANTAHHAANQAAQAAQQALQAAQQAAQVAQRAQQDAGGLFASGSLDNLYGSSGSKLLHGSSPPGPPRFTEGYQAAPGPVMGHTSMHPQGMALYPHAYPQQPVTGVQQQQQQGQQQQGQQQQGQQQQPGGLQQPGAQHQQFQGGQLPYQTAPPSHHHQLGQASRGLL